ncbi:uncharacterized protein LOC119090100 isoform X2 [Pollicipes pollicipes]|uniref:uncharacterized protein LOC119090100 isoform X2 n=1 Tax=Pollicipes pollicipes TaxID=41117 RepID=UPI00188514FF|nr:uncharacterized protein LOC119090100 isoform X2 [Pollicipes pollicipes]
MNSAMVDVLCDLLGSEEDREAARLLGVSEALLEPLLRDPRLPEEDDEDEDTPAGSLAEDEDSGGQPSPSSEAPRSSQESELAMLYRLLDPTHVTQPTPPSRPSESSHSSQPSESSHSPQPSQSSKPSEDARPPGRPGPSHAPHPSLAGSLPSPLPRQRPRPSGAVDSPQRAQQRDSAGTAALLTRRTRPPRNLTFRHWVEPGQRAKMGLKRPWREDGGTSEPDARGKPSRKPRPYDRFFFRNMLTDLSELDFWHQFHVSKTTVQKLWTDLALHYNGALSGKHSSRPARPLLSVIMMSLWLLNSKEFFRAAAQRFDVPVSGLFEAFGHFCSMVVACYGPLIAWPDRTEMATVRAGFRQLTGVPAVLGALSVTRVRMFPSSEDRERYRDQLGHSSVAMLVVCDHQLRFRDVFAACPGSFSNTEVLLSTPLYSHLQDAAERATLLPDRTVLIGHGGLPLTSWLMRPYGGGETLTAAQERLQDGLRRGSRLADQALGYLRCRFARLGCGNVKRVDRVSQMFLCCCLLHNLELQLEGDQAMGGLVEVEEPEGLQEAVQWTPHDEDTGRREQLAADMLEPLV